jgi:hypothetical protein
VLPRLLQIGAIAGAIQCDFTLLAAALRADAAVNGGAEAFFLANFADGATQIGESTLPHYRIASSRARMP